MTDDHRDGEREGGHGTSGEPATGSPQGLGVLPHETAPSSAVPSFSITNGPFSAYLLLMLKRDQAFRERGELDPLTWIGIRDQAAEDPRLSEGERRRVVGKCDNRLRGAWSFWG